MVDFFEFFIYLIHSITGFLFSIDLGIGFSFGDAFVALIVLGVVVSALVIRYKRGSL